MIVAFSRVHYGKDYLSDVIRSALPFVDRFLVMYTPVPTFGRSTPLRCPDTRDEIHELAVSSAGDKLDWREDVPVEAGTAISIYNDADMVIEMDADEVYHQDLLAHMVESYRTGKLTEYCYRLPFLHHWRSFYYTCKDASWPARLYIPANKGKDTVYYEDAPAFVHHFGYARSTSDMQYKWETSVHMPELRLDWWDTWKAFPDRLTDLHPTIENYWCAEPLDRAALPAALINHPYGDMEVIP
jgi:hypothetical protein